MGKENSLQFTAQKFGIGGYASSPVCPMRLLLCFYNLTKDVSKNLQFQPTHSKFLSQLFLYA